MFEYGTEYEGTVRGETETLRSHASLSNAAVELIHYYVQRDGVDDKFYFHNARDHHSTTNYTLEANFNGTMYRFIDGMVTSSSLAALDPVFNPGTRVLFTPIAVSQFKAIKETGEWLVDETQSTWPVRGGKAATTIKRIDDAAASSHKSGEDEVRRALESIRDYYSSGLITQQEFETKKQEVLARI
jgi:ketosteroid isomerase-like protein